MTLRILRENKKTLMSVLESFVHDPLVEWSKRKSSNSKDQGTELGKKVLLNVSNKLEGGMGLTYQYNIALASKSRNLQGIVAAANGVGMTGLTPPTRPRSVEGQVRELIDQATSLDLLSRMWIGWSAFY